MSFADRFRLIACVHDLAETPVATGDERSCWVPVSQFRPWLARLEDTAAQSGVTVELTSDDAFASDYTDLLPLLLATGRTATFFIPTAFIGRPGRLDAAQIRELHRLGMRIGTHGTHHVPWARIPHAEARADILDSIAHLEDLIGAPITAAAPPFGSIDRHAVGVLRDNGIDEIHTCDGGYAITAGPLRTRVALSSDASVNEAIIALAARRPNARDALRGAWHVLRTAPLPLPAYAPRRRLAAASASS